MKLNNISLPNYLGSDYNTYYTDIIEDFRNIKTYFPLLNLTILPTVTPKEIYLTGKLIPYHIISQCKTKGDINRNSLDVRIIYPSSYPSEMIVIEDLFKRICWDKVPNEHVHRNIYKSNIQVLCTHHPNGEINEIGKKNKSIAVLYSGWSLFMQYKQYIKSGKWILRDLKHGEDAIKQLKSMGKYYYNKKERR